MQVPAIRLLENIIREEILLLREISDPPKDSSGNPITQRNVDDKVYIWNKSIGNYVLPAYVEYPDVPTRYILDKSKWEDDSKGGNYLGINYGADADKVLDVLHTEFKLAERWFTKLRPDKTNAIKILKTLGKITNEHVLHTVWQNQIVGNDEVPALTSWGKYLTQGLNSNFIEFDGPHAQKEKAEAIEAILGWIDVLKTVGTKGDGAIATNNYKKEYSYARKMLKQTMDAPIDIDWRQIDGFGGTITPQEFTELPDAAQEIIQYVLYLFGPIGRVGSWIIAAHRSYKAYETGQKYNAGLILISQAAFGLADMGFKYITTLGRSGRIALIDKLSKSENVVLNALEQKFINSAVKHVGQKEISQYLVRQTQIEIITALKIGMRGGNVSAYRIAVALNNGFLTLGQIVKPIFKFMTAIGVFELANYTGDKLWTYVYTESGMAKINKKEQFQILIDNDETLEEMQPPGEYSISADELGL